MPELTLTVNGRRYGGWKEIRVTRGIESVAGSFALSVSERWGGQIAPWPIADGDACSIEIDGVRVIAGFVDTRAHGYTAETHSLSVAGRDRTADLVDCSAVIGTYELGAAPPLLTVCRRLAEPFGVTVALQDGLTLPAPPDKITISPGDTAFEVIDRACRMAGVLAVADGAGGLLLTRAGRGRAVTDLVEGVNVLEAVAEYDSSRRYARYVVAAQHSGGDSLFGDAAAAVEAEARDENVTRQARVLMIRPEAKATQAYAQQRANWEAAVRAARGARVGITVQGWTQGDGSLWPVNALVRVRSRTIAIDNDLLIAEATYTLSASAGTRTSLTLRRPGAFLPEPVLAKEGAGADWDRLFERPAS